MHSIQRGYILIMYTCSSFIIFLWFTSLFSLCIFFQSLLYLVNIRHTAIANIYRCKLKWRFIRLDLVVSGNLCKQDKHWLIKVCHSSLFDNCDILRAWDWFVPIHNNHHYIIWPTSPRSHLHKLAPILIIYVAPHPLHLPTCCELT